MGSDHPPFSRGPLLALAGVALGLHAAATAQHGYGYFADEFYFLECADRLAWGYVDHPPLSVAVLAGVRAVLGESLPALRSLPALLPNRGNTQRLPVREQAC